MKSWIIVTYLKSNICIFLLFCAWWKWRVQQIFTYWLLKITDQLLRIRWIPMDEHFVVFWIQKSGLWYELKTRLRTFTRFLKSLWYFQTDLYWGWFLENLNDFSFWSYRKWVFQHSKICILAIYNFDCWIIEKGCVSTFE